jgi:catechol-2,3-dioxygenase
MTAELESVAIDTRDIAGLSAFYQALAGWTETYTSDDWITLTTEDGWQIDLQAAPDHVAPRWPSADHPQQAHLDLRVPDIDAAAERAVELGATLLRKNETWHTLADPAGHPFDLCLNRENPKMTVMGVMLDCPDSKTLSAFYSKLLDKPITYEAEGVAMIGNEGERPVLFQQVADYRAPQWPDPAHPQQFHLDIRVDDIDAAEKTALALGATSLDAGGKTFRVYADPAGKPFCLCFD